MSKRISSKDNQIFKELLRLEKRKYRDREGRFIIEGPNLVEEAIARDRGIEAIIVREDVDFPTDHPSVRIMDEKLFRSIAFTENSQGVMAILEKPRWDLQVLEEKGGCAVVLDRLQDPGNIGTVVRTAEAAGYKAVICVKGTSDPYSPKAVRAAAGSILRMPIIFTGEESDTVELLKRSGKKIAVTLPDGDNDYYDTDLSGDIGLIVGNEGNGCSRKFISSADIRVSIPMEGSTESLNASVACGILMYERMRKNKTR